mgnify:FL=1
MQTNSDLNKHGNRSAQTRRRFIASAQKLLAQRGVDAVSINELTAAAGQRNRTALQYHFGDRNGLLQAIIDHHAARVTTLRSGLLAKTETGEYRTESPTAAEALIRPLVDYIAQQPDGVYYIMILSQLAILDSPQLNPNSQARVNFQEDLQLLSIMKDAMAHLTPSEARQRMFLATSLTFHGIADVCRACGDTPAAMRDRAAMFAQLINAVNAILAAPATEG